MTSPCLSVCKIVCQKSNQNIELPFPLVLHVPPGDDLAVCPPPHGLYPFSSLPPFPRSISPLSDRNWPPVRECPLGDLQPLPFLSAATISTSQPTSARNCLFSSDRFCFPQQIWSLLFLSWGSPLRKRRYLNGKKSTVQEKWSVFRVWRLQGNLWLGLSGGRSGQGQDKVAITIIILWWLSPLVL